ncbi:MULTISPECIES: roadblock/LC7 domain-containing protein [unclassified Streptomyces]|uniref:roadblock/LC7 domain-containing protein n=1 Tax=unclassified Streptomyces TaxID=2593676 RepID=UPI0019093E95|nr:MULTISPECIES: roadblock/LC7 domain-containing protein [unclassified Streptomyces]MBK3568442.1 roadblock/LC7 domain-containing protein [Streptomyces sp. MBT62]MBK6017682.1 roadblock/LC7 domain-containing protein [Streptomyces sp. MBT53]
MTAPNTTHGGLAWLLDNLIERIPETLHAIVLSEDGLLVGSSEKLAQEDAEQLAAISSGVHSLALGTSRHFGGGRVQQTVIEMDDLFLFVTTAGGGARLAVLATSEVDVGNVGYEMTMVVRQVGQFLSAAPRFPEYSGVPFAGEHE